MSYGHWQGVERVTHSQTDTLPFIHKPNRFAHYVVIMRVSKTPEF